MNSKLFTIAAIAAATIAAFAAPAHAKEKQKGLVCAIHNVNENLSISYAADSEDTLVEQRFYGSMAYWELRITRTAPGANAFQVIVAPRYSSSIRFFETPEGTKSNGSGGMGDFRAGTNFKINFEVNEYPVSVSCKADAGAQASKQLSDGKSSKAVEESEFREAKSVDSNLSDGVKRQQATGKISI